MNSKERVRAAIKREPTDRVPIFMWFHPETTRHFAEVLDVRPSDVATCFGNDVRMTWVNNNYAMEGITHERDGEGHTDYWGIEWVKEGPFNQITGFPLAEADRETVLRYEFPTDRLEDLMSLMKPLLPYAAEYFIGCDVSPCVFEMYWRLRGMEQAIFDIASDPELSRAMFAKCADFAVLLSREACRRFPLDWLWTGDDVASQLGLMMSPRTFRDQVKPELARVFAVGKELGLPVAFHCCGSLRPIIPDLIEIGLDVLNPIQCNCPGMDAAELKREFGRHLTFMGGVDTQGVLPNGSAADVRRATAGLIDTMTTDGGGFILAASHTVPPETPDANVFAMYEVAGVPRDLIFDTAARLRRQYRDEETVR